MMRVGSGLTTKMSQPVHGELTGSTESVLKSSHRPEIILNLGIPSEELGTSSASPLLRVGGGEKKRLPLVEILTVEKFCPKKGNANGNAKLSLSLSSPMSASGVAPVDKAALFPRDVT